MLNTPLLRSHCHVALTKYAGMLPGEKVCSKQQRLLKCVTFNEPRGTIWNAGSWHFPIAHWMRKEIVWRNSITGSELHFLDLSYSFLLFVLLARVLAEECANGSRMQLLKIAGRGNDKLPSLMPKQLCSVIVWRPGVYGAPQNAGKCCLHGGFL